MYGINQRFKIFELIYFLQNIHPIKKMAFMKKQILSIGTLATLFIFFFCLQIQAQDFNLQEALKNPSEVKSLKLESSSSNISDFIENVGSFSQLEKIEIRGSIPEDDTKNLFETLVGINGLKDLTLNDNFIESFPLGDFKNLEILAIRFNTSLDFGKILAAFKNLPSLTSLTLDNNELADLDFKANNLSNLKELYITGGQLLNYNNLVEDLSKLANLAVLGLPIDELEEIPVTIGKMQKLKTLFLEYSVFKNINEEFVASGQDVIKGKGKIVVNPNIKTKKLEINYVRYSANPDLTKTQKAFIQDLFPDAKIVKVINGKTLDLKTPYQADQVKTIKGANGTTTTKAAAKNDGMKVYSAAYGMYDDFFNKNSKDETDYTKFEDRYKSPEYAFTEKIVEGAKFDKEKKIYLQLYKNGEKDEIWFNFERNAFFSRNFTEMNSFAGMQWVYDGGMTEKEFALAYLKKPWDDVRVRFNPDAQNFTIILKHPETPEELPVYLRMNSKTIPVERAKTSYQTRFTRYDAALKRKADFFDKKLERTKQMAGKTSQRDDAIKWKAFQQKMSIEERRLTQEQWMAYRKAVLEDEEKALNNSTATLETMILRLKLYGYPKATELPKGAKSMQASFINTSRRTLLVNKVAIINKGSGKIVEYPIKGGAKSVEIEYEPDQGTIILAQLRTGELGVFSAYNFSKVEDDKPSSYAFQLELFPKGEINVGKMMKELELE